MIYPKHGDMHRAVIYKDPEKPEAAPKLGKLVGLERAAGVCLFR